MGQLSIGWFYFTDSIFLCMCVIIQKSEQEGVKVGRSGRRERLRVVHGCKISKGRRQCRFLLGPDYYKQCCSEHWGICIFSNYGFLQKWPKCPLTEEWVRMWYVYTMEYSVPFNRSVVPDSLWTHGLQHARLPCPSPTPRVYSDSCPSSQWCHPAISSSVIPSSSCPQSLPAS